MTGTVIYLLGIVAVGFCLLFRFVVNNNILSDMVKNRGKKKVIIYLIIYMLLSWISFIYEMYLFYQEKKYKNKIIQNK